MDQEQILKLGHELSELKLRARNVGYKNNIPKLPSLKNREIGHQNSVMSGFYKRLSNWTNGLNVMENPGGLITEHRINLDLEATTVKLSEHFNVIKQ